MFCFLIYFIIFCCVTLHHSISMDNFQNNTLVEDTRTVRYSHFERNNLERKRFLYIPVDIQKEIFSALNDKDKRIYGSTNRLMRNLFNERFHLLNLKKNHSQWKSLILEPNVLFVLNEMLRKIIGLHINMSEGRGSQEDLYKFEKLSFIVKKFPFLNFDPSILKYPSFLRLHIIFNRQDFYDRRLSFPNLDKKFQKLYSRFQNYFKHKDDDDFNIHSIKMHFELFVEKKKYCNINFKTECSFLDNIKNYFTLKKLIKDITLSSSKEFAHIWEQVLDLDSGPTINDLRLAACSHFNNRDFKRSSYYFSSIIKELQPFNCSLRIGDIRNTFKSFVFEKKYYSALDIYNTYLDNKYYLGLTDMLILRHIYTNIGDYHNLILISKKIIKLLGIYTKGEDYRCLAYGYFCVKNYNKSIYYYKKTLDNCAVANDFYMISNSYLKKEMYKQALDNALKYVEWSNNEIMPDKIKYLLFVLSKTCNYPRSIYLCEKYIGQIDGDCDTDCLRYAAIINNQYGNIARSVYYYERIFTKNDSTINDLLQASMIHFITGNYEKENQYFDKALSLSKNNINSIIEYVIRLIKTRSRDQLVDKYGHL